MELKFVSKRIIYFHSSWYSNQLYQITIILNPGSVTLQMSHPSQESL